MSTCYQPVKLRYNTVPCGKCLACLEDRQRDWYFRNYLEFYYNSVSAFFVTVTYEDSHLPMIGCVKLKKDIPALDYGEVTRLIKKVRLKLPKFRYFAVSEYSPVGRPHYHFLIYFNEVVALQSVINAFTLSWTVPYTANRQPEPLGIVQVELMTSGRICYVTQYLLVKSFNETYDFLDPLLQPKSWMSRRPGIGDLAIFGNPRAQKITTYFKEHPFENTMYFPDGSPIDMPRYFEGKIFSATLLRIRRAINRAKSVDRPELSKTFLNTLRLEKTQEYKFKSYRRKNDV